MLTHKKYTPKKILELEKIYGFEIPAVEYVRWDITGYVADEDGEVIELVFHNKLTCDLAPLAELSSLRLLICNNNQIEDLSPLAKIKYLQELYCAGNRIRDLTPLRKLRYLQTLNFANNRVKNLSPLSQLTSLKTLACLKNQIEELSPLSNLTSVQTFYCGVNQIKDLGPLAGMTSLHSLSCEYNQIKDLSPLSGLKFLQTLQCWNNEIKSLSPLSEIGSLQSLYCWGNQIKDLKPIVGLIYLKNLDCSFNKITHFPEFLLKLDLPIQQNSLITHKSDGKLDNINGINIHGNPWQVPPIDVLSKGSDSVKAYFQEKQEQGSEFFGEARVMVIGDKGCGKTSLIKCLTGQNFNIAESTTKGVEQTEDRVASGDRFIDTCLWEFSGQDYLRTAHPFFFNERCLLILILNGISNNSPENWLELIRLHIGDAPVMLVVNNQDSNYYDIDYKNLKSIYPGLRGLHHLCCRDMQGISEFRQAYEDEVKKMDMANAVMPKNWVDAKQELENLPDSYISKEKFSFECKKLGMKNQQSHETLLEMLHSLGTFLIYPDLELKFTQIINPNWLVQAIYKILNDKTIQEKKGRLELSQLTEILQPKPIKKDGMYSKLSRALRFTSTGKGVVNRFSGLSRKVKQKKTPPPQYIESDYPHILYIMQKFKIAFQVGERRDQYIIPALLPKGKPKALLPQAAVIRFQIDFDYLPSALIGRLIVEFSDMIMDDKVWATGVIIKSPKFSAMAEIIANPLKGQLDIRVSGNDKRRLLTQIRKEVAKINKEYQGRLRYTEKMPVSYRGKDTVINYNELVGLSTMGVKKYSSGILRQEFSVKKLLDSIEVSAEEKEKIKKEKESKIVRYLRK